MAHNNSLQEHYLCAKCESQVTTHACPMCRELYAQYEEEEE